MTKPDALTSNYVSSIKVNYCFRCAKAPKIYVRNDANRPDVARKFVYKFECECGNTVTCSNPQEGADAWNVRYGFNAKHQKMINESQFISDITVDSFDLFDSDKKFICEEE